MSCLHLKGWGRLYHGELTIVKHADWLPGAMGFDMLASTLKITHGR
jgi:hypothetical protein